MAKTTQQIAEEFAAALARKMFTEYIGGPPPTFLSVEDLAADLAPALASVMVGVFEAARVRAADYFVEYRGHRIVLKRDFGSGFHLIDGMPCMWGYVVTKDGYNVMPGATWFQTVEAAKHGIDCLIRADGDAGKFWEYIRANDAMRALVQRVANLNRDAGEIGAGMLAQLVDAARAILPQDGP